MIFQFLQRTAQQLCGIPKYTSYLEIDWLHVKKLLSLLNKYRNIQQ